MSELPQDAVMIPSLCETHKRKVVHGLGIPAHGPWMVAVVTAQILLFQFATLDKEVWDAAEGDTAKLSRVLAGYGCLACKYYKGFGKAMVILRKGVSHAAQVAQGKICDPDWIDLTPKQTPPDETKGQAE